MAEDVVISGSLVVAKAGRDKGNYFVVIEANDNYVVITDGNKRRKDNPKLKNVRHVKPTGLIVEEVVERYSELTDAELNRIIKEYAGRLICRKKT